ncbi:MAG: dTDP-4-dehydrorhamnose 3,5-epimerase [Stygiobacter sp. RIFOXYC12_FULL_38_8]|nr:MAG: dTDP-4-dehydrorhamnose 3,5-epimerase [Stygiobacter sp. GWC2_38_9]OGU77214.1 MAG: dTDP-4-dehydrorhamnose 3,5-epimerase [Stygiobacter sp. RIFOXYA12_FULL_38_9]OGV07487.1 MAG: dTDP-4-dehydrorhamnose 3,5-epimerase [Stygiobacter sp. RIFOXYB2_FULL_37_11]OGV13747.1 MAG: dTDP-4-dehydrorhamnose 3,5-epimerase [Stygiobacter sp. RIFOXYC2_FULL_38_25]OGV15207.1 MAG: dTDP-4-dehydrorhamnose 3,5-epimerase [Stygiobacter sp. RIFOXYA2_FULL_38_8]OGV23352.1 MAG: dTDP-4-dehydrorhamnose 3,5-epimerase [Stygioba
MNFEKVFIDGLLVVQPDVFLDERGYFFESFNKEKYVDGGINFSFVQDNISKSKKGTVRGLHYQVGESAQGKLCSVIVGKVLDIAVDIRFGSPTFGKYYSLELNEEKKNQLWIPPGFAHGFSVLSDDAIFSYKCTNIYNKQAERSILYNDEMLKIDWKVEMPIVSPKDLLAKKFSEIEKDFIYQTERG